jgi:signal recognition particle receptor subunit beta
MNCYHHLKRISTIIAANKQPTKQNNSIHKITQVSPRTLANINQYD